MAQLQDLRQLKVELDIDPNNTSEDKKLLIWLDLATQWIEEYLDRPGLFYAVRTEYYKGTNTQKLLLRSRPVYQTPLIQCFVDEGGNFGETAGSFNPTNSNLVYGVDFGLQVDQPDGITSRSGILYRINDLWPRPFVRVIGLLSPFIGEDFGSIKVTYGGGYLIDNLPAMLREAVTLIVTRLRVLLPIGLVPAGESYEERAIQYANPFGANAGKTKEFLMNLAAPLLFTFRNWSF